MALTKRCFHFFGLMYHFLYCWENIKRQMSIPFLSIKYLLISFFVFGLFDVQNTTWTLPFKKFGVQTQMCELLWTLFLLRAISQFAFLLSELNYYLLSLLLAMWLLAPSFYSEFKWNHLSLVSDFCLTKQNILSKFCKNIQLDVSILFDF